MTKAIRIHAHGGPEVLQWEEITVAAPGAGEVLVRHTAIGVNYIDTYHRGGFYPLALPAGLGCEAAGVVTATGPGVSTLQVGDRVAYATVAPGSYAGLRVMPAERLLKIPAGVSDRQAAAMMLKGLTAQYLIRRTYPVKRGQTVLFHAIAGGVGLIACQWLKHLGATVIGTVGSEAKATLAREYGCDHVIVYTREDFVTRVRAITQGEGVPVVYDAVGKDTFMKSLDCLQPFGLLASFGQASGPIPPLDVGVLAAKGSLYVTRPTLGTYAAKRADLELMANELFDVVAAGHVRIDETREYALADAAQAHRDLEGRRTTGSIVLIP